MQAQQKYCDLTFDKNYVMTVIMKEEISPTQRFETLFQDYHEDVLRYISAKVSDRKIAEDLASETFMVAWRRLDRVPYCLSAKLWLISVGNKIMANWFRSRQRQNNLLRKISSELPTKVSVTHEDKLPYEYFRDNLEIALDKIPSTEREIIRLAVFEGRSHKDIASILSCSSNAVGIKLYRARRSLAKELSKLDSTLPISIT